MQGTLFSSDYVIDANGNERLIEINTDTAFTQEFIDNYLNLTDFINVLSSNNIAEVVIIYKDFHYKVKFSKVFSNKSKAEAIESYWLQERFPNPGPNKVWIEDYLQCEHKQKYNDTGITEIRLLKKYQLAEVLKELYNTLSVKDKQFKAEAKKQYV